MTRGTYYTRASCTDFPNIVRYPKLMEPQCNRAGVGGGGGGIVILLLLPEVVFIRSTELLLLGVLMG